MIFKIWRKTILYKYLYIIFKRILQFLKNHFNNVQIVVIVIVKRYSCSITLLLFVSRNFLSKSHVKLWISHIYNSPVHFYKLMDNIPAKPEKLAVTIPHLQLLYKAPVAKLAPAATAVMRRGFYKKAKRTALTQAASLYAIPFRARFTVYIHARVRAPLPPAR